MQTHAAVEYRQKNSHAGEDALTASIRFGALAFACNVMMGMVMGMGMGMAGSAHAEEAPPGDTVVATASDPLLTELRAACERGDLDAAYALVNRMLAKTTFERGIVAYSGGNLADAAVAFQRVIQIDPENQRARLELARTLWEQGNYVGAEKEFQTVLQARPPETVERNIRKFLDQMGAGKKRGSWGFKFSVGGIYDDNVNVGPASQRIRVAPINIGGSTIDTLTVNEDTQPKETAGLFAYGMLSGQYDVGSPGDWSVNGLASYYQTFLDKYNDDYAIRYAKALGGLQRAAPRYSIELPLVYETIDRGGDSLADIYGCDPSYTHASSGGKAFWITSGSAEWRDYADFDTRDALYFEARETLNRYIGAARHSLSLGAAGFYEDADSDAFDNMGAEVSVGGEAKLPWRTCLYGRLRYRGSWYDQREVLAPEDRHDNEWQANLGLNKKFNQHWSTDVSLQRTSNNSAFDIYDYDRNIAIVGVNAEF
jgi:tetratricopeptide (TPR) repeat protein